VPGYRSTRHTVNPSPIQIHWWAKCQVSRLGFGLAIGLVSGSYESVCITSAVILPLPKIASDELTVFRSAEPWGSLTPLFESLDFFYCMFALEYCSHIH